MFLWNLVSILGLLKTSVLAQEVITNCLETQWLPDNTVYNPGNDCQPWDGSKIPNCSYFVHPGHEQPYYHVHEYDCSKFWECGPAKEACLFHCAPCGDLCPGWNGLSFDCRYQYPYGPVCDYPGNVECENHIPCPSCPASCDNDWQTCDESTGCVCGPECRTDPDCEDSEYCDDNGTCQEGCRDDSGCATSCSQCVNHECMDPSCCSDEDCPNGVCLNGECVPCIVDDDCDSCATCEANQCVLPSCCSDEDCPDGVCLNGECVSCIVDDDCDSCATCEDNQCVLPTCCSDEDCPDGVCLDGECVECAVDDDCNLTGGCSTCQANSCVAPQCCADEDCPVGQHCNDGVCDGECTDSSHCPYGDSAALCDVPSYFQCQYCDLDSHLCEQGCDSDSNCPGDYPVCSPDHKCGCTDTSDCVGGTGTLCDVPDYTQCSYCDPENAQCKPGCDEDADCPSDFPTCDLDSHTCGCSDSSECTGSDAVCDVTDYQNCFYCDAQDAQCKPGCVTDDNCPSDFPVCGANHRCGCVANSDCENSDGVCDVDSVPDYTTCNYCDLFDSECKPGCWDDSNCPSSYVCDMSHTCVLDGECDENRPCVDDEPVICDSVYSTCTYCDLDSKTCEPGCEANSECIGFGDNTICNPEHICQAIGVSGVINIAVSTYTCEGCPASGGFETVEGGLQLSLDANGIGCDTNGLDNVDLRDYDNGIVANFDADHWAADQDDDGMGGCRGADLNLRLTGGSATWLGTGTWTAASEIPVCINFFGDFKPTCCCELETRSLAQGESSDLIGCACCGTPPCF